MIYTDQYIRPPGIGSGMLLSRLEALLEPDKMKNMVREKEGFTYSE